MKVTYLAIALAITLAILWSGANVGAMSQNNSIQQVKAEHEAQLMQLPGVISVGLGKNNAGELIIIVGVEKDDVAITSNIPEELAGYPVTVQTIGDIRAQ